MIIPARTNTTIAAWIQIHDGDTAPPYPSPAPAHGSAQQTPARGSGREAPGVERHHSGVFARNRAGAISWRIAAVDAGSPSSRNSLP